MTVSELKSHLTEMNTVNFKLPNGNNIPSHFHITEVGLVTKHFIDCGGEIHQEKSANVQIWVASDFDHRLQPKGFLSILDISKKVFIDEDLKIEVEYQSETVGKYGLTIENGDFILTSTHTDCLAKDTCGIPGNKNLLNPLKLEVASNSCCAPGGGCC